MRPALLAAGLALFSFALRAEPLRAQAAESPALELEPSSDRYEMIASRLGGWSPQFELGFGVLTQSQDGESTVPVNSACGSTT